MEKRKIIIILGIILIILVAVFFFRSYITGNVVSETSSYTKAICNDQTGKCVDVLVECENGEVKSLKPMSEVLVIEGNGVVDNSELC
jgi:hypothetical protein